jgi:hypothetical protein
MVNFNNSSLVKTKIKGQKTPSNPINVNIGQCRSSKKQSEVDVKRVYINNLMMASYGRNM